jgi:transposase
VTIESGTALASIRQSSVIKQCSYYIGLNVHKDAIAISIVSADGSQPRYYGEITNASKAIVKLVKKLNPDGEVLDFCYETGPCGYVLYRQLARMGHGCIVVAPSLIPSKTGDRVKTDRRDSEGLARLHRANKLTSVCVSNTEQESIRDLTRARENMKNLERILTSACPFCSTSCFLGKVLVIYFND